MKKKIICFILTALMLISAMPLSVFADEVSNIIEENSKPIVKVESMYVFDRGADYEFRALPDDFGTFYFDISLSKNPEVDEEIIVFYRTVDDSAVAKWGDYEAVGTYGEAYVTLNKANKYKARVVVNSTILDISGIMMEKNVENNMDRLASRRFIFELTKVEGKAVIANDNQSCRNKLYCYLRADSYFYIKNDKFRPELYNSASDVLPNMVMNYSNPINTEFIYGDKSTTGEINYQFSSEVKDLLSAGYYQLGISLIGICREDYWNSDGPVTFNLYYTYQGKKQKALTFVIEGEFDDSTYFGWEHAFDYVYGDYSDEENCSLAHDLGFDKHYHVDIDDYIEDNFYGLTVYDNDGNVAYSAVKNSDRSVSQLGRDLKNLVLKGDVIRATRYEYGDLSIRRHQISVDTNNLYYATLPSNFAYADSYSWEFISETSPSEQDEGRRLQDVFLICNLLQNNELTYAKDASGKQMITTNANTLREGDKLRMSIRYNQFVTLEKLAQDCYVTAKINGKYDVKLTLKGMDGSDWGTDETYAPYLYPTDTLVFECDIPDELKGTAITSIRNIELNEPKRWHTRAGIESFVTRTRPVDKNIYDIYLQGSDMRTPAATISFSTGDSWVRSRPIDVYVNTKENSSARFLDYVTVYYQWSNSPELPEKYGSKIQFNTPDDNSTLKTIIGTGNGEMYLHMKSTSGYGKSSISDAVTGVYAPTDSSAKYTPFGPFRFDNSAPEFSVENMVISGDMKNRTISFEMPSDDNGSGLQTMTLYYIPKNSETGEGVPLKKFTRDNFSGDPLKLEFTISHKDVGVCVDNNGNEIIDRQEVEFYWIVSDKLGNTNDEPIRFKIFFDTNDYLNSEITFAGPENITSDGSYKEFKNTTENIDDVTFLYNYAFNTGKPYYVNSLNSKPVSYGFRFDIDHAAFGATDAGEYSVKIFFKGEEFTDFTFQNDTNTGYYAIWFYGEDVSGRYDIQLVRTEGDSVRTSRTYSVYVTNSYSDATAVKGMIQSGTLLNNTVYQLSSQYNYFYYKDIDGIIQKEYYNGTKLPASFSTYAKAKEYVYYMELGDIYLMQLTAATANALNSGTAGYLIAKGETMTPQAGQYWIRYKSSAWTPTSGDTAWVYYYYGMSDELTSGSFSQNLQNALNSVSKRITDYGGYVLLTDYSLIGISMGDKKLDEYGMPYLLEAQIHNHDEFSNQTKCGNKWSFQAYYTADKNIYTSNVYVGVEGSAEYKEFPIVGNFTIPAGSQFQYMSYQEYGSSTAWKPITLSEGETFVDFFTSSGIYYIRELAIAGASVYPIYIDKAAPEVNFSKKDENGALVEIPVDGVEITDIRTSNLIIGSISATEYDRLAYVAIYKVANLDFVGVYTAEELELAPVSLEDGNYYIVVSDRSGNHYTVNAKISSSDLQCEIREYPDKFIKLTCNRKSDQILRYEVYLNGVLVTSTYAIEQTFEQAGLYTIYVQDIYGNEFSEEFLFSRNYPTVTWKYLGSDGKYHAYDEKSPSTDGFVMTWLSDNSYKISTSVKTRFSFDGNYGYEFIGSKPEYTESISAETVVTISEGQSFTLKVFYKNHSDCYVMYSGVVDVTPPSISVLGEIDSLVEGEQSLFDQWLLNGKVGDILTLDELYYTLAEKSQKVVVNGGSVSSDIIRINVSDINDLSLVEVYLDGALIKKQDTSSGFSQIIVSRWGNYKIVAKDSLGNLSEFSFINGMPEGVNYFVDGVKKELELHSHLKFEVIDGKHVYTKVDYGNKEFKLDVTTDGTIFISVGVSGGKTAIYGYRVSGGSVYPMNYTIVLDKDGNEEIDFAAGGALVDVNSPNFKIDTDYVLNAGGAYAIYASVDANKKVSFKVYAPEDTSKVVSINARIELTSEHASFVSAEISKKSSEISFKDANGNEILPSQSSHDVRANSGFIIDKNFFEIERVSSIRLYYSKYNDLNENSLSDKTDIYAEGKLYEDDGFYLLIVKNHFGNETIYRIGISRNFGITSSVTFDDGQKIYYSKDYLGTLYSNNEIMIDLLNDDVKYVVTKNGVAYTGFQEKNENGIMCLVFSEEGRYQVRLTDSYGNVVVKQIEISKSTYTIDDKLLTGYNDKALKRNEGYTNQKLSIDKNVFDNSGIYYLAIKYGDKLTVLMDSFSESSVNVDYQKLVNAVGNDGDGVYTVICRNRYGAIVTKDIHYRGTPTLKLERTTRSKSEAEIYDLDYAISLGFWSNNTLIFSTDATTYEFTVNGNATECPRTLAFGNAGDFGSSEYTITYIDEYGFEYSFKAYLIRKNVTVDLSPDVEGIEIDGILNTRNDISITFGENTYATYTINNGESLIYHSGEVLKKDGTYRFIVTDYAGNISTLIVRKDTIVDFEFVESNTSTVIQSGAVVNSSKVGLNILNKDSAYIEKVLKNGVVQNDFNGTKFNEDGKWELILSDKLGNKAYFCFYIVTRMQNGFTYTTPYEYHVAEMWFDSGDGVRVSYLNFVNHTDYNSSFSFSENGKYTVVMASSVTGKTSSFEFTVNTLPPNVSLVGCAAGETTIQDVSIEGCKVGDTIKIYKATDTGDKLVEVVEVTSSATKMPTVTEGGKYRVVVESEAGVATELTFVRKHVMNTAGSVFVMIMIGVAIVALFAGLIYRNKSKTDN